MGVSSYALLVGSVLLNRTAYNQFMEYSTDLDQQSSDESLDRSWELESRSKICAYSAIGIWTINLIWTATKASKVKNNSFISRNSQKIKIFSCYNPRFKSGELTLKYTF